MKTHAISTGFPAVLRGTSPAAEQQQRQLAAAAVGKDPVLIVAESGMDVAQVAAILHGPSRPQQFIPLDCGEASTDTLIERLFGGPETPVRRRRDLEQVSGRSALAARRGTTIFVANVTEMGASVQRRLARVLRDGEVYLDDSPRPAAVEARLVASGPPDILEEVELGHFSGPLHRRLAGCQIVLVPLRRRPADIPEIVQALGDELAAQFGMAPRPFTPAALTALGSLGWARNLDDLRELLERLHADRSASVVRQEDVLCALGLGNPNASQPVTRFDNLRLARQRFEREYIAAVLERHGWRMSEAAATLGIERANLYRKIRQLGLPRPQNGAAGEH